VDGTAIRIGEVHTLGSQKRVAQILRDALGHTLPPRDSAGWTRTGDGDTLDGPPPPDPWSDFMQTWARKGA
jgi:hypothetical protein